MKLTKAEIAKLPKELQEELKLDRDRGLADKVYEVLDEELPMSINEVLVALWEKYSEVHTRSSVAGSLSYQHNQGWARRCGLGSYVKVPEA